MMRTDLHHHVWTEPLLDALAARRGGPSVELRDPESYYDTSSYGPMIVESMARWVGSAQRVYGSDRPVIEPVHTGREVELMTTATTLLTRARSLA
jgi:hypothetical protein